MNLLICVMLTLVALSPVPEIAGKVVDYDGKVDSACAISNAIRVDVGFTSVVGLRLIKGLCQSALEFVKSPLSK